MNADIDLNHRKLPRSVSNTLPGYVTKAASRTWEKTLLLLAVIGVLLPTSPYNMPLTYRDSGVFLYIGWRILNGELPYRDVWDHKPPFIYYLNALGLAISNDSRWGIWLLEVITVLVAAMVGYKLIEKSLGRLPTVFSTLLWLFTLGFVLEGGNLTEEYALPLQFACLLLIYEYEKSPRTYYRLFLIGLLTSVAFFTKQTTIGIGIAIVIYLIVSRLFSRQGKLMLRELSFIAGGSLLVTITVIAFFSVQGTLQQFWSAVFQYNFVYSSTIRGIGPRLEPFRIGLNPLAEVGLLQLSLIGYFLCLLWIFLRREYPNSSKVLFSVAIIGFPIELLLVSISGRFPPHYFISLLPALTLLGAYACWFILHQVSKIGLSPRAQSLFVVFTGGLLIFVMLSGYHRNTKTYQQLRYFPINAYIRNSTSPDETVLLWGAEASKNFFAQRRSPSRYIYLSPLYNPKYADEQMVSEFLDELVQNRPKLIIDTRNPQTPIWDFPVESTTTQLLIQSIRSQYLEKENIGRWIVYEFVGEKQ